MPQPSLNSPGSSPEAPGAEQAPTVAAIVAEMRRIADAELELPAPLTADARLQADLALDSLGLTVLAVGLEDRYRVRLDEQDVAGIVTVRDLAVLVRRRIEEQGS